MSKSSPPTSALKTYTPLERNMYLVGMFGQNIFFNILAVYTGYYMTNVLYVPAATVGIILVIAQVFDAFNDPIMGTVMDKTRTKIGKARPFLLVVPILVAMLTITCFCLPTTGETALPDWAVAFMAGGFYIFWGMVYTAGDIPLWGASALMTENKKHQEVLQSLARMVAGIGAAVPVLLFQTVSIMVGKNMFKSYYVSQGFADFAEKFDALEKSFEPNIAEKMVELYKGFENPISMQDYIQQSLHFEKRGYIYTCIAFTILAYLTFQMVGIFMREKITPSEKSNGVIENFKMMIRNKPYRQVLISGILSAPRNITMIVALPMVQLYFATKDPNAVMLYLVLLGGPLFGGTFAATALVPKLSEKFSKKQLYNASNLLEIIPNLLIFIIFIFMPDKMANIAVLIPMMVMFLLKGACLGLFNALQTNMIADAVDYEDYKNHIRPDGVFFSGQTFMVKIGMGISNIFWLGWLCDWVGYSGDNIKALNDMVARSSEKLYNFMGSDFFGVITRFFQNGYKFPQENIIHTAEILDSRTRDVISVVTITADQLHMFFAIMFFAISILPAISNVLAVIPTWNYAMDTEMREKVVKKLQERRRIEGNIQD